MAKKVFRSVGKFEKFYFPSYCKKYPIPMRVTEEEKKLILSYRHTWT